jgi:hypothetical protein
MPPRTQSIGCSLSMYDTKLMVYDLHRELARDGVCSPDQPVRDGGPSDVGGRLETTVP